MPEFLQFVFSGLTVGAVYALVALGFTLIYNASDVVNFAQGEFVMLGGMTTVFLGVAGVPLPLGGVPRHRRHRRGRACAPPLRDRDRARRQRRGADHHHHRRLDLPARRRAGPVRQALPQPAALFGADPIRVGGAAILPQSLVVLGGAVVIVVLLWAFIDRTLFGKAIVATAANRLAARLVGIDTRRIVGVSFALSAAIGAVAGILVTPITLTSYDVGTLLAVKGFAAAMLGGMGSPVGAVVGGLILGLLEAFGGRLRLLEVQGRGRVPGHPAGAVRHAARIVRPATAERV